MLQQAMFLSKDSLTLLQFGPPALVRVLRPVIRSRFSCSCKSYSVKSVIFNGMGTISRLIKPFHGANPEPAVGLQPSYQFSVKPMWCTCAYQGNAPLHHQVLPVRSPVEKVNEQTTRRTAAPDWSRGSQPDFCICFCLVFQSIMQFCFWNVPFLD